MNCSAAGLLSKHTTDIVHQPGQSVGLIYFKEIIVIVNFSATKSVIVIDPVNLTGKTFNIYRIGYCKV